MEKENPQIYRDFYDNLFNSFENYRKEIMKIGFAFPEATAFSEAPKTVEELLDCMKKIMSFGVDLNRVLEVCPNSIYVVDKEGNTLRANQAFTHTTGTERERVLGKNVYDMEKLGYYHPSVNGIALREKRPISIIQMGKNGKETVVTGVPVLDSNGNIYRCVSNAKLIEEIQGIMKFKEAQKNLYNIQKKTGQRMIGESASMKEIKYIIDHIVDTDSSILITGETGVGKGVLTRYIHENSKRKDHRLIEINCGAIPESLFESELFGYESGAFTGADKRGKPGLIELANGGTVFFDEVNELPLLLQVKLLHFLQNKKIIRVGGTKEIEVDTRIIAASNKKLGKLVTEEKFRADLYYRLNVVPVVIPPLRERPEDILAAADYFLEKFNRNYDKNVKIDEAYKRKLLQYSWPGNLRQLENQIERTVVTGTYDHITSDSLISDNILHLHNDSTLDETPHQKLSLYEALDKLEKAMVKNAYERNKSSYKVAEELGISQPSAHRKIIKYLDETKQG